MMADSRGAKQPLPSDAVVVAAGHVAVAAPNDAKRLEEVAQAGARWSNGYPGLKRALERSARNPLPARLHRFYRTASDALVFACHIDGDGDTRCHVMAADPANVFDIASCGNSYWVFKAGVVSRDEFLDATSGGWLMEELPWTAPALAQQGMDPRLTLDWTPSLGQEYVGAAVRPGLWRTCNGSVAAVSRVSAVDWGATVVLGGKRSSRDPQTSPGSHYRLTNTGAVLLHEALVEDVQTAHRMFVTLSGMALSSRIDVFDGSGQGVEILEWAASA